MYDDDRDRQDDQKAPRELSWAVRERLTWQIVAILMARHGRRLMPAQHLYNHYDLIVMVDKTCLPGVSQLIALNRDGYGHSLPWTEQHRRFPDIWRRSLESSGVAQMASSLARAAKLGTPRKGNPARSEAFTYRAIAAFLTMVPGEEWRCVNGQVDTNFGEGGVRDDLFSLYPVARHRLSEERPSDMMGRSAYRFWFLCRDGAPIAALEPEAGLAWRRDGVEIDIHAASSSGRKVWAVAELLSEGL